MIGTLLGKKRSVKYRSDIFSVTEPEFYPLVSSASYSGRQKFYFLAQKNVLESCLHKWGVECRDDELKFTEKDKLRAMLIMFSTEEMRERIPFLQPKTDKSSRLLLDEFKQQQRATYSLVYGKFIDSEVKVNFPTKWYEDDSKLKLSAKHGPDAWQTYTSTLDPNDQQRIKLPWTKEHITTLLKTTVVEYNKVMNDYQKKTGGGDGDEVLFVSWDERDPFYCVITLVLIYYIEYTKTFLLIPKSM